MAGLESVSAESMIDKILHLPTDVRRNMDLLLILDQNWMATFSKLGTAREDYVAAVRARVEKLPRDGNLRAASADPAALKVVTDMQDKCLQFAEEKVAVAQQAYDLVAVALEKLTVDLRRFEAELKANGEITEDVRAATAAPRPPSPSQARCFFLTPLAPPPLHTQQPNYQEVDSGAEEEEYYRPQQRQGGGGGGAARAAAPAPTSHRAGAGAQQQSLPRAAQSSYGGGAAAYGGGGGGGGYGAGAEQAAVATAVYCLCRRPDGGEMVACENPKGCRNGEWFHYECVNLPPGWEAPPTLKWYCPPCKRGLQEQVLAEQEHTLSVAQQQQLHAQQQLKEAQARAQAAAQAALANASHKAGAAKAKAAKAVAAVAAPPLPPRPT
jgi:hypothetical protein